MAKPRGETRDRAFGGKAGIWLKRKKQSVIHPNDNDDGASSKKVTPPSLNVASGTLSLVASTETTVEESTLNVGANATQRTMVGWDDVRCRPVYMETSSWGPSTSSLEEEDEEEQPEARDDEQASDDDLSVGDKEEENDRDDVPSSLLTTRNDNGSRKSRAYGSRKRKPSSNLLSTHPHEPNNRKRQHISEKKKSTVASAAASAVMTPLTNRMAFDLATPQTGAGTNKNICSALNSETKAAAAPLLPVPDTAYNTGPPKDTKLPKKKGPGVLQRRKRAEKQPAVPPSLSQLDFVDENVSQPSSTTSLAAARAFFERLDSQQTLTLDASGTPHDNKAKCVRTRRAIHVDSDSLQQEYQAYAASTRATGVEPLSVEQYAMNRSLFFRTGEMYDGFLDG